jgi:hypothetical protein
MEVLVETVSAVTVEVAETVLVAVFVAVELANNA